MRRLFPILAAVLLLAQPAAAFAPDATNVNYRSTITSVTPAAPGLTVSILDYNDELVLTNHTGKTVTVLGYSGEPYARVLADGTVQVSTTSPAYYLNETFYATNPVPATVTPSSAPRWTTLDRTGRFQWHDHLIHYDSALTPPQVTDKHKTTFIFAWKVPILVGATPVAINGTLYWIGQSSGFPAWALISMILVIVIGLPLAFVVQRRRIAEDDADW